MLLNKETGLMSVRTAPSIPKIAQDRLENLKPSANGGSCGNAVFKNEPQFVQNTFTEERWKDLKEVAIDFNICSCWSIPIQDKEKNAIGSFALSSFEHRFPSPFHIKLLKMAASIVSIVLINERTIKRNNLLSNAMQNSSDGMIITNEKNEIIEINESIQEIYGYKEEELIGQNPKIFSSNIHEKDFYKKMWDELNSKSKWSGEIINKKKDGSLINQWISITSLHNQEENIAHNYLALFTDLTEIKESQNKIQFMAFHDSLTKLYNKSYLETILDTKKEKT
jgi:PAS domain S-box-containing protein